MEKQLEIRFGILNPSIKMQLKKQKLNFSIEAAKNFEDYRQSLITLHFGGILNDSEYQKALNKLFNKIKAHVKIKNKPVKQ